MAARPYRGVILDFGNTLIGMDPALHSKRTDYADVVAVPGAERMVRHLEKRGLVPRAAGLEFMDRWLRIRESNRLRADASGDEITAAASLLETFRASGLPEPSEEAVREALDVQFGPEEERIVALPGAAETVRALRDARIPTALLSNATDSRYIRRIVERFGWSGCFDVLAVTSDLGVRKPRAEAFSAVLSKWDFASGEVAMVGDSLYYDVMGGQAVGLATIHFTLLPHPLDPDYRGRVVPHATAASHEELIRLLI